MLAMPYPWYWTCSVHLQHRLYRHIITVQTRNQVTIIICHRYVQTYMISNRHSLTLLSHITVRFKVVSDQRPFQILRSTGHHHHLSMSENHRCSSFSHHIDKRHDNELVLHVAFLGRIFYFLVINRGRSRRFHKGGPFRISKQFVIRKRWWWWPGFWFVLLWCVCTTCAGGGLSMFNTMDRA
jgi:hypothetical protein